MEYLITGGAGFIGTKFCEYLFRNQRSFISLDDFSKGKIENVFDKKSFLQIDCSSYAFEKWLINIKPKHIIHLCGQSSGERSYEDPSNDFIRNVLTTRRLLSSSLFNENLKSITFASSMAVYGNKLDACENDLVKPISWYGRHKYLSENLLEEFSNKNENVKCNSLRLFNVYGEGQDLDDFQQGMISIFISMAVRNNKIIVNGAGSRIRDFIHIDDVVKAIDKISKRNKGQNYEVFNVGTGEERKIYDVVSTIAKLTNSGVSYSENRTPHDQDYCYANMKKTNSLINFYHKENFYKVIERMINWAYKFK